MLKNCAAQAFLRKFAHVSTSCGRYARNGYKHCGRCLLALSDVPHFMHGTLRTKRNMFMATCREMMQAMPATTMFAPPPWPSLPRRLRDFKMGLVLR